MWEPALLAMLTSPAEASNDRVPLALGLFPAAPAAAGQPPAAARAQPGRRALRALLPLAGHPGIRRRGLAQPQPVVGLPRRAGLAAAGDGRRPAAVGGRTGPASHHRPRPDAGGGHLRQHGGAGPAIEWPE